MRAFVLFFLFLIDAAATTYNAASAARADVQTALNLASSGDIVTIPSGTVTWTDTDASGYGVLIPAGVTLQGAGTGATNITDDCNATAPYGAIGVSGADITITGITITAGTTNPSPSLIRGYDTERIRIHNNEINCGGDDRGIWLIGDLGGSVIDNNDFTAESGGGTFQQITISGRSDEAPEEDAESWGEGPQFGTDRSVYVEDNTFTQDVQGDSTLETYVGGRVVFRYNTCTNFLMGVHGNDSSIRSGHVFECYSNTINNTIGSQIGPIFIIRGGTAYIYDNTITASGTNFAIMNQTQLQQYRSSYQINLANGDLDGYQNDDGNTPYHETDGVGTHTGSNNASTLTDSTQSWATDVLEGTGTYSLVDDLSAYVIWNRTDGSRGYITAHTSTTVTATLAGGAENDWDNGDAYVITWGYPGLDQPGWAGPTTFHKDTATNTYYTHSTQVLTPIYIWDNTFNGAGNAVPGGVGFTSYAATVQPDSEMFLVEGREWYDDGSEPAGYTPYTYPHPLRGQAGSAYTGQLRLNSSGAKPNLSGGARFKLD